MKGFPLKHRALKADVILIGVENVLFVGKCTICRHVCTSFIQEILQVGAVTGLIYVFISL